MSTSKQLADDFAYLIHHSVDYRALTTPENLQRTCAVCLDLLTQLPSARETIFDYFNSLIGIGVHCFIQKDPLVTTVTDLLTNIETKLVSLANQSSSWAHILAQWSIDQLFQIIQRYINDPVVKHCETRDDRLQLWTQCQAAMTLIKISSACILHDTRAADTALNKFLVASILLQPIFDWVTVSLSLRCGPMLVSRLIQLSLQELDQPQAIKGFPRIFAIWSSLGIIAEQEPEVFHQALTERIQLLLNSADPQKQSSITLFIRMTSVVPDPLSDIVYYSLYRSLNPLSVRRLCVSIRQTKTAEEIEQLTKEFLYGLLSIRTDAFEIIQFLLSFIPDDVSTDRDEIELTLRDCSRYLLEQLCHECHYKFRLQKENQRAKIAILQALRPSFDQLLLLLNHTRSSDQRAIIQDLCFTVALYHGDEIMLKYLQYAFTHRTDLLPDILLEFEYYHRNASRNALTLIFEQNERDQLTICLENLLHLVLAQDRSIQSTIWSLIDHFSRLLSDPSLSSENSQVILQIFLQLNVYSTPPSYAQMLQLASAFTDLHMKIVEESSESCIDQLLLWRDTLFHLIHFNNHEFHLLTLITLIDFLIPRLNILEKLEEGPGHSRLTEKTATLLEQNLEVTNLNPNRILSRSFQRSLGSDRWVKISSEFADQYLILMTEIFNELLAQEPPHNDNQTKPSLLLSLAMTLIDNILPDATIDNQFEDDQCKMPNERNLALIRRLDEQPMIWILFELITPDFGAFQLCIPIVRSLLSALIVQWENVRGEDRAKQYPKQLNLSTNVITLLKKARFLPLPLNEIYELFPLITAYDCYTLLSNVWNYLKQNQQSLLTRTAPLPSFILRDSQYLDPIRFVIQKNIAEIGPIAEHFLHLQ